jgi:predicted metal-binding membrane protein
VATAAALATSSPARRSLTHLVAWHPEWWVYPVAGAAGVLLVLLQVRSTTAWPSAGHLAHGGRVTADAPSPGALATALSGAWGHWMLMVAAMMLPVVAPQVRAVALRSIWSRRYRSSTVFLTGYLLVWLVAGAALLALVVVLRLQDHGTPLVVLTLLVAASWQVTGPRRRVLRRCATLRLGAATGFAADRDCARAGLTYGLRCLVACWPGMLAMVLSHNLLLMAGLLAVMRSERARGPDPARRAGRPLEACVLGSFALVAAATVVFA